MTAQFSPPSIPPGYQAAYSTFTTTQSHHPPCAGPCCQQQAHAPPNQPAFYPFDPRQQSYSPQQQAYSPQQQGYAPQPPQPQSYPSPQQLAHAQQLQYHQQQEFVQHAQLHARQQQYAQQQQQHAQQQRPPQTQVYMEHPEHVTPQYVAQLAQQYPQHPYLQSQQTQAPPQSLPLQERSVNVPTSNAQKRKRTSTIGEQTLQYQPTPQYLQPQPPKQAPPPYQPNVQRLQAAILAMDINFLSDFAMTIAMTQPLAAEMLLQQHETILEEERTSIMDFAPSANAVLAAINITGGGSDQYELASSSFESIRKIIRTDIQDLIKPSSCYATKSNALHALHDIGDTICEAGDTIGHQIRVKFQGDSTLEDAMKHVLECMGAEQRVQVRGNGFMGKMRDMTKRSRGLCTFQAMDQICDLLEGIGSSPNPVNGE